jgi:general stress protein YciG
MSNATENTAVPNKPLRGFAAMTAEQRRALGSKGGRTAHERGTANKFTSESATVAGKIPHERGTAHKWTSEEARQAGRKGGSAARRRRSLEPMG